MFAELTVIIISWCKSNHDAVHLKLTQCCTSIYILIKLEEKRSYLEVLTPWTSNVTEFRNRVFTEVKRRQWGHQGEIQLDTTDDLVRRVLDTETDPRRAIPLQAQATASPAALEAKRKARDRFSTTAIRARPCPHRDLGRLAPELWESKFLLLEAILVWGALLINPRKQHSPTQTDLENLMLMKTDTKGHVITWRFLWNVQNRWFP